MLKDNMYNDLTEAIDKHLLPQEKVLTEWKLGYHRFIRTYIYLAYIIDGSDGTTSFPIRIPGNTIGEVIVKDRHIIDIKICEDIYDGGTKSKRHQYYDSGILDEVKKFIGKPFIYGPTT